MKNIRKRDKPKMEKAYFTESKESYQTDVGKGSKGKIYRKATASISSWVGRKISRASRCLTRGNGDRRVEGGGG